MNVKDGLDDEDDDQLRLIFEQLMQNRREALALCVARMETCPDGLAQLSVLSSEADMECWKTNFFRLNKQDRKLDVKKITIQVK